MIEARADAVVPAPPDVVFAVATDLEAADWIPDVRQVRRLDGPDGVGARYEVDVAVVGRRVVSTIVCRDLDPPKRAVYVLEDGLELEIEVSVTPVPGGSSLALVARYSLSGPLAAAMERATAGPARREVARAVEQLAARFGRKG